MGVVVDASVAVKWFLSETNSSTALELFSQGPVLAPAFLRIEAASAISRRFRTGGIDAVHAKSLFRDVLNDIAAPNVVLLPDETFLGRAMEIYIQIQHALADCMYVACAEANRTDLVTSDATLLILLKKSDFAPMRKFACPLSHIAHLRHEGIAAHAGNLTQEPRSAFSSASRGVAPLQNEIDENRALSPSGLFQQYLLKRAARAFPFVRAL